MADQEGVGRAQEDSRDEGRPLKKTKKKKKNMPPLPPVSRWVSRTTSPPPHLSSLIKRGQPQRLNLLAPLEVPQRVALEPERAMET